MTCSQDQWDALILLNGSDGIGIPELHAAVIIVSADYSTWFMALYWLIWAYDSRRVPWAPSLNSYNSIKPLWDRHTPRWWRYTCWQWLVLFGRFIFSFALYWVYFQLDDFNGCLMSACRHDSHSTQSTIPWCVLRIGILFLITLRIASSLQRFFSRIAVANSRFDQPPILHWRSSFIRCGIPSTALPTKRLSRVLISVSSISCHSTPHRVFLVVLQYSLRCLISIRPSLIYCGWTFTLEYSWHAVATSWLCCTRIAHRTFCWPIIDLTHLGVRREWPTWGKWLFRLQQ